MLEKPPIADTRIIAHLQEEYPLQIKAFTFLPLGADLGTAVYRVDTADGRAYFLKLRKGFEEITVTVPLLLRSQGVQEIIAPVETRSHRAWVDFDAYKMILYPFIEGQDGFERELTDAHRKTLGRALKMIHAAQLPPEIKTHLPTENFSPRWRERLKSLQRLVESSAFTDPSAAKLAEFMKSRKNEIEQLIERTEELASDVRSQSLDLVLCHTDIHGGNILIGDDDHLYIVDWDAPLLAPRERDLMFIGGGIDRIWKSKRDEAIFYEGYGEYEINVAALAYHRYARIIEDLAVTGEQLLLSNEGGADRERSYGWFTSNFEPGDTIAIARNTDS